MIIKHVINILEQNFQLGQSSNTGSSNNTLSVPQAFSPKASRSQTIPQAFSPSKSNNTLEIPRMTAGSSRTRTSAPRPMNVSAGQRSMFTR